MKANLLPSLCCLLAVSCAQSFAARPAQAGATGGEVSAPAPTDAPKDSKIGVENWAKPQPGWLYVLDPKPDAAGPGGRIWLINPETAKVMGSIRTGNNADFALSPDGSRLYVASITKVIRANSRPSIPPRARSCRGARSRTAKWLTCCRHFQPWRCQAMGWRCESWSTHLNRQTGICSCSPPSTRKPASFCRGACACITAAPAASSPMQPQIISTSSVREATGSG